MYFEIFRKGKLIKRGTRIIGGLSWHNELMYVPSTTLTLEMEYYEYLTGREEIKIYVNGKCFFGTVTHIEVDKANEVIEVDVEHIVTEWTYRQISVNNAVKDKNINIVYKGAKTETNGDVSITASPFYVGVEEVGKLSDATYIERAGASAWTASGESVSVSVDTSKIKDEEGEYDVTFKANGASVTVEATVSVTEYKKENKTYKISGHDFSLLASEVPLTDAQYIRKAGVKATDMSGTAQTVTVDADDVKDEAGRYSVTFKVDELSMTVKCIVYADVPTGDETVADNIADIYADMNFAYPGWTLNMSDEAKEETIDYVYSRQNKLDALTKTMELTEDLWWRVGFTDERVMDISAFGEKKEWMISKLPSGPNNIRLIDDPRIVYDIENVVNLATVYSEKSDSGMSSMTLREVYNDPDLQKDGFPVVILRANVNNERDYKAYTTQYPKLAPNNELEFGVLDLTSIAAELGTIIEGTFAFNDLAPFKDEDEKTVTDKDRIRAAKTAYKAAIKKLKQSRRKYQIQVSTEELPAEINVGDKVRFIYDNSLYDVHECGAFMKKVLSKDDFFYLTSIDYEINETGGEVDTITLEKTLRIDRDTNEQ